jgi:hypothetical protein
VVVPYEKLQVVAAPLALAVPLTVAPELVTLELPPVVVDGGETADPVV